MKKILFVLSIAFLLLSSKHCNAAEISSSFNQTFIGSYHYVDQNGRFGDFELFQRGEDGKIAYCIEPGTSFSSIEYEGAYDLTNQELANKVGVTEEQLQRISVIAYFGYGYQDHNSTEWIVATQAKIWEVLGRQFQFTSKNSQANPWAYVISTPTEIKEKMDIIEGLVQSYYNIPPINGKHLIVPIGERYTMSSNSLTFYELQEKYSGVSKSGNIIAINPKEPETVTVKLKQELNNYSTPFIVYYHNSSQNLLLTGNIPGQEISFTYEALFGSAEIIKYDADTKSCYSAIGQPMENAIYGLYKSDGTLIQKVTVSNCQGKVENLTLGEYYWQELEAPTGYILDTQKYNFTITTSNIKDTQIIQVYDKEDLKEIQIKKEYLKENETLIQEQGAKFEIIDKNTEETVATLTTDNTGFASTFLRYGTYILKQISGTTGYEFIEPIEFVVEKNTDNIFTYSLVNKPILKNIKVKKKDDNLKNQILQSGIKFKLYDVTNKKYICQNEECTFETNEYGELIINDLYYSTYRLEELDQDLPGYLWNQEGLEFTIDDESSDEILLEFYNQPVEGEIIISKTDENGNPLQDIVFQIFAKEDIYQNQVLLYKKGELVAEIITQQNGIATLKRLPLGSYTIKELKTQTGYQIDSNTYDITLEYRDNKTAIITENLSFINYKIPETKKNSTILPINILCLGLGYYLYEKKYFCL